MPRSPPGRSVGAAAGLAKGLSRESVGAGRGMRAGRAEPAASSAPGPGRQSGQRALRGRVGGRNPLPARARSPASIRAHLDEHADLSGDPARDRGRDARIAARQAFPRPAGNGVSPPQLLPQDRRRHRTGDRAIHDRKTALRPAAASQPERLGELGAGQCAFSPLGLGSTQTLVRPRARSCGPTTTFFIPNAAANAPTPAMASHCGASVARLRPAAAARPREAPRRPARRRARWRGRRRW